MPTARPNNVFSTGNELRTPTADIHEIITAPERQPRVLGAAKVGVRPYAIAKQALA